MDAKSCTRQTLATGDFTLVEQCSCGSVHITIGAITMRLSPGALPSLAMVLGEAARTIVLREALVTRSTPNEVLS
jgi:hypothetical protein